MRVPPEEEDATATLLTRSAPEAPEPAEDVGQTIGQEVLPAHLLQRLRALEPPTATPSRSPERRPRPVGQGKRRGTGAGRALALGVLVTASVLGTAGALWYVLH